MLVRCADGFVELLLLLLVELLTRALQLFELDLDERAGGRIAAHHRVACRRPGKNEARVVGLPAHGVMARAEAAAANHGNLGHNAVRHGVDHFRAGSDDPAPFRVFADHEAVHVVQENKRDAVLVAVEDEARRLLRGLRIDHSAELDALLVRTGSKRLHVLFLVRDDTDGPAANARIAAEQGFAVFGAVFLEFACVHNARDDFAHVVLLRRFGGEDAVNFFASVARIARRRVAEGRSVRRAHLVHESPNALEARLVVFLAEIHRAADLRVHLGSAEIFRRSFLANGSLHERRPREKEPRPLGHQNVVAHDRQIRAAGHAHAHNGRYLWDAHRAHHRVVAEDAAKIIRIGKDVFLQRQEYSRRIHQINGWDAVLDGDVLRADDLFRRHREEGAGLYRRIVRDDHKQPPAHAAEPGHCACGRGAAPFFIHLISGVDAQLKKAGIRIDEFGDALARRQPAFGVLRFDRFWPAALADAFLFIFDFRQEIDDPARVLGIVGRLQVEGGFQGRSRHSLTSLWVTAKRSTRRAYLRQASWRRAAKRSLRRREQQYKGYSLVARACGAEEGGLGVQFI